MFKKTILLKLLISLLIPLLLVLGTVQVLVTDQYLGLEYGKTDFPADPFGLNQAQRLEYAAANFRWVREGQPIQVLATQRLGDRSLYNQRELKHMQDVQDVFLTTRQVWYITLGLMIVTGGFLAYRKETLQELAQGLKIGGLLISCLVAVIGLLAVIAWKIWFVAFHQVFFSPGSWTFNTSDTLIRLFPERFWFDAALTISLLSLIGGVGTALLGWYMQRGNPSKPEVRRSFIVKPMKGQSKESL